jgi:hypothetical protein
MRAGQQQRAVVLSDQRWPRARARSRSARLGSRGVAAVFAVLAFACPAFAHEHPKGNIDSHFLDTLERPDNASNPSRNLAGTFNSRLCCTNQDAVKVDKMVVRDGGKYPEPEWYVWIDLDGTGVKKGSRAARKDRGGLRTDRAGLCVRARKHDPVFRPATAENLDMACDGA